VNPSNLPWWGWLLCSIIPGVISWFASGAAQDDGNLFEWLVTIAFGIAAAFSALVGMILFVKWVWNG
jgi:hypothetical protein